MQIALTAKHQHWALTSVLLFEQFSQRRDECVRLKPRLRSPLVACLGSSIEHFGQLSSTIRKRMPLLPMINKRLLCLC